MEKDFALQCKLLTLKVLVATIDAQWEGMGDVGSTRYEPALLPPCPTIRVVNWDVVGLEGRFQHIFVPLCLPVFVPFSS